MTNYVRGRRHTPPRWPYRINRQSWQSHGLMGWWTGDPLATDLRDLTGNGWNGTKVAHPMVSSALGVPVIDFTPAAATDNWITLPSGNILDNPAEYTITLWARIDSAGSFPGFILFDFNLGALEPSGFVLQSGAPIFLHQDGTNSQGSSTAMTVGRWHQLVGVWDGTNRVTYMDGTDVSGSVSTGSWNRSGNTIGDGFSEELDGQLWDLRLYNYGWEAGQAMEFYRPRARFDLFARRERTVFVPAGATANPKGPLGHPLHGPLAGPIGP